MQNSTPHAPPCDASSPPTILAASLLAANFAQLASEAQATLQGGATWLHIDVMDGHFVPNLSMGPCVVSALSKTLPAFFDVHMMVSVPENWVAQFANAGATQYTFHLEAVQSTDAAISLAKYIRSTGMMAGLAIKPDTPVTDAFDAINSRLFNVLLIMTVEPGFGGQKFMPNMMEKVKYARTLYPSLNIEVY